LTLVTVGVVTAIIVRHASTRYKWFGGFVRKAPYFSSGLNSVIDIYMAIHGWHGLMSQGG